MFTFLSLLNFEIEPIIRLYSSFEGSIGLFKSILLGAQIKD